MSSQESLSNASKSRLEFSRHGNSLGAAGYVCRNQETAGNNDFLGRSGDSIAVSPPKGGFDKINVGAAWDNDTALSKSMIGRLLKIEKKLDIDLDLGCLYEMQDGTRGAVQAFGDLFGSYDAAPYIQLSGDERTGDAEGDDEYMLINGQKWSEIKRVILYIYIYKGAQDWAQVAPQIQLRIPGEKQIVVSPSVHSKNLSLCVIAGLENNRNGMNVTNYTEFFPGHEEMDRAFGWGLQWDDGHKGE
jgi:tellurite resistance protein TerA